MSKDAEKQEVPTTVKDFINDPKAKQVALASAQTIVHLCGKKWFIASNVSAKFRIGLHDAIQKLEALKLFGFIHERIENGKEKEYKVTLTEQHRYDLLMIDIKFYEQKIAIIKKEAEKLKAKIDEQKKQ